MDTGQNIESTLADLTGLGLDRVRESQDEVLTAGIHRMVMLICAPDERIGGGGEKSRLDA